MRIYFTLEAPAAAAAFFFLLAPGFPLLKSYTSSSSSVTLTLSWLFSFLSSLILVSSSSIYDPFLFSNYYEMLSFGFYCFKLFNFLFSLIPFLRNPKYGKINFSLNFLIWIKEIYGSYIIKNLRILLYIFIEFFIHLINFLAILLSLKFVFLEILDRVVMIYIDFVLIQSNPENICVLLHQ